MSFFHHHHRRNGSRGLSLLIVKALENDKQIKLRDEQQGRKALPKVPYIFHLSLWNVDSLVIEWLHYWHWTFLFFIFTKERLNQIRMKNNNSFVLKNFSIYTSSALSLCSVFCVVGGSTFFVCFVDLLKFTIFDVWMCAW